MPSVSALFLPVCRDTDATKKATFSGTQTASGTVMVSAAVAYDCSWVYVEADY